MPVVSVRNAEVRYQVDGSGPGLVLVHGVGGGSELAWGWLVDRFSDRFTVIRLDTSGSDETLDDGGELTVEMLAEQVAGVIEDSGAAPVDLVGFSLGAVVAAAVAASRPDLVRRLVLTAGWARPDDEYMQNLIHAWQRVAEVDAEAFGRFATFTAFSRTFLQAIGHEAVEHIATNMKPTPNTLRQLDLLTRLDIRDLLPKIAAETLVIGCTLDHTIPVENSREIHAAIPGSRYAELVSGHVVVYERPDEFVALVRDFIDGPAAGSRRDRTGAGTPALRS